MENLRQKIVKCSGWTGKKKCNKSLKIQEAFKIVKGDKYVYTCPDCFPRVYEGLAYGRLQIQRQDLDRGLMDEHPDDIKQKIWKWTKNQK